MSFDALNLNMNVSSSSSSISSSTIVEVPIGMKGISEKSRERETSSASSSRTFSTSILICPSPPGCIIGVSTDSMITAEAKLSAKMNAIRIVVSFIKRDWVGDLKGLWGDFVFWSGEIICFS